MTTTAAISLLAVLIARPAPVRAAAAAEVTPTASAAAAGDPTVWESDGVGNTKVWRDHAGRLTAVMYTVEPSGKGATSCRLEVGGQPVEATAVIGQPAICVWVRDAA